MGWPSRCWPCASPPGNRHAGCSGPTRCGPLSLRLLTAQQRQQQEAIRAATNTLYWVMVGVFLLLTLLHYTFYLYNPTQRGNRYFARYALALSLAFGCVNYSGFSWALLPSWHWGLAVLAIEFGLLVLGLLWLVRAMYALFGFQPGRVYGCLVVSGVILLLAQVVTLVSFGAQYPFLSFVVLVLVELLRLTGLALRRRRRGARIVAGGFAGGLATILLYLGLKVAGVYLPIVADNLLLLLAVFFPALAISLFLAREFALDAELLQVQLGEVERLSAQTIAQEQDKQALLAQQNETLETQVQQRTSELQRSLTDLRATQQQLIQKEKMASLGELTAGIAHEIQNPLNFVNNFAEVSTELVAELRQERAKGSAADTELEEDLLTDLDQNLVKISQHGQRAASIVRGMLEHSRASTGERQPTDVSALCDEYLRLAYHGLRAKDKSFNAQLETDLATDLPLVEAVGQDLGRVLLNLFNNAFYAVQKRQQQGELDYRPTVSVSTKRVGEQVAIRVADNGTGMPEDVRAKIFQPFFTTKPSGEGTGLGLSLSHDIITKGHGGTLTVESQPGQGTVFTSWLPV
jgi:two-component system NtrC family sensor kinase